MAIKGRIFSSRFSLTPRTARRSSGRRKPPRIVLSSSISISIGSEMPGSSDSSPIPARLMSTRSPRRNLWRTVRGPPLPPVASAGTGKTGELSGTDRGCGEKPGEREGFGARTENPEAIIFPSRKIRDRRRIALGSLRLLFRDGPPGLPELVPDAVDQGLPGGFDEVVRDTDGPPLGFLVPGPYQDPYRGTRPSRADDPDLVVEQLHLGKFRVELLERLPDGVVHRVHRTVAERRRMLDRSVDLDHDGRLGDGRPRLRPLLVDHPESLELEERLVGPVRPAHQDLERGLGRLELVSLVLEILDLIEDPLRRGISGLELDPFLLELRQDVASSREVGDEDAPAVAHRFRGDVLVRPRMTADGRYVHPPLVREGGCPHEPPGGPVTDIGHPPPAAGKGR